MNHTPLDFTCQGLTFIGSMNSKVQSKKNKRLAFILILDFTKVHESQSLSRKGQHLAFILILDFIVDQAWIS